MSTSQSWAVAVAARLISFKLLIFGVFSFPKKCVQNLRVRLYVLSRFIAAGYFEPKNQESYGCWRRKAPPQSKLYCTIKIPTSTCWLDKVDHYMWYASWKERKRICNQPKPPGVNMSCVHKKLDTVLMTKMYRVGSFTDFASELTPGSWKKYGAVSRQRKYTVVLWKYRAEKWPIFCV